MIFWNFTCSTTLNSNYTICRFLANKFKDLGLYGNSILEASEVSSVDIILIIEGNGNKWVTSSVDFKWVYLLGSTVEYEILDIIKWK